MLPVVSSSQLCFSQVEAAPSSPCLTFPSLATPAERRECVFQETPTNVWHWGIGWARWALLDQGGGSVGSASPELCGLGVGRGFTKGKSRGRSAHGTAPGGCIHLSQGRWVLGRPGCSMSTMKGHWSFGSGRAHTGAGYFPFPRAQSPP